MDSQELKHRTKPEEQGGGETEEIDASTAAADMNSSGKARRQKKKGPGPTWFSLIGPCGFIPNFVNDNGYLPVRIEQSVSEHRKALLFPASLGLAHGLFGECFSIESVRLACLGRQWVS
ncbi:Uncharacterized protein Adt_01496 [Abeliophyllum distichum]|uniref:Uncharacterized protein n=1 Tax=Abeliophyllum distichum TaxID=126358 RepID=A0ABD1VUZ6_9LAMI